MAITVNNESIIVEYDTDDPKGNSFGNPYTIDDIISAVNESVYDVAFTNYNNSQVTFIVPIIIKGTSTYFKDSDKQIYLINETSSYKLFFDIQVNVNAELENITFSSDGYINGFRNYGNSEIKNTSFYGFWMIQSGFDSHMENISTFNCNTGINSYVAGSTLKNISIYGSTYGFELRQNPLIMENINIYSSINAFNGYFANDFEIKVYNTNLYDTANTGRLAPNTPNVVVSFVDCKITTDDFYINSWGSNAGTLRIRNYSTFSVILNQGDVNIKIYDKDDSLIYEDVEVDNEEILYSERIGVVESGEVISITDTNYQPLKVVVTKQGYDDLVISDINIAAGQPTIIRGELVETEPPIYIDRNIQGNISQPQLEGEIKAEELLYGTIEKEIELSGEIMELVEIEGNVETIELKGTIS